MKITIFLDLFDIPNNDEDEKNKDENPRTKIIQYVKYKIGILDKEIKLLIKHSQTL